MSKFDDIQKQIDLLHELETAGRREIPDTISPLVKVAVVPVTVAALNSGGIAFADGMPSQPRENITMGNFQPQIDAAIEASAAGLTKKEVKDEPKKQPLVPMAEETARAYSGVMGVIDSKSKLSPTAPIADLTNLDSALTSAIKDAEKKASVNSSFKTTPVVGEYKKIVIVQHGKTVEREVPVPADKDVEMKILDTKGTTVSHQVPKDQLPQTVYLMKKAGINDRDMWVNDTFPALLDKKGNVVAAGEPPKPEVVIPVPAPVEPNIVITGPAPQEVPGKNPVSKTPEAAKPPVEATPPTTVAPAPSAPETGATAATPPVEAPNPPTTVAPETPQSPEPAPEAPAATQETVDHDDVINQFLAALSLVESDTNGDGIAEAEARNRRTGAYRYTQIMGNNWAPWSKQTFGEVRPHTPENHLLVARHIIKGYYFSLNHNLEAVAIAWFAGPSAAERYMKGDKSVLRRGDGLSSVAEYKNKVLSLVGKVNPSEVIPHWDKAFAPLVVIENPTPAESAKEETSAPAPVVPEPAPAPEPEPVAPPAPEKKHYSVAGEGLVRPVDGPITSDFGPRKAPTNGASTNHEGTDFKAGVGTPVKVMQDGEVVKVDEDRVNGKRIDVRHGETTDNKEVVSKYIHLSDNDDVKVGDHVDQGQVIGKTGNTGRSSGPHLHAEIEVDGQEVDLEPYFEGKKF